MDGCDFLLRHQNTPLNKKQAPTAPRWCWDLSGHVVVCCMCGQSTLFRAREDTPMWGDVGRSVIM